MCREELLQDFCWCAGGLRQIATVALCRRLQAYRGCFYLAILIDIRATETARQLEIKLKCSHLPRSFKSIFHQNVYLWAIESSVPSCNNIISWADMLI